MNDATTQHVGPAVRASDAEREQAVALLQRNFAVLSHLAGAVLVGAGVIVAMPAISGSLHRTRVIVCRAFPVRGSHRWDPPPSKPGITDGWLRAARPGGRACRR